LKEERAAGGPQGPDKMIFNIYDFIEEEAFDDKGNTLGRKPHVNNIKGDLL
jgi:hypothetical protein